MQSVFESLKNIQKADFFKKVNLHIHTNCSDGVLSPSEVIEQALSKNMRIISITDHNTLDAYKNIDIARYSDLKIITGIEFDCWYKSNFMHILGYGVDPNNENINELCAKNLKGRTLDLVRFFNKRKAKDVIEVIKDAGGISVLAHPACCWNINIRRMIKELKELGLDGVEVYYPYIRHRKIVKFHSRKTIQNVASESNLLITGGTDCHSRAIEIYTIK